MGYDELFIDLVKTLKIKKGSLNYPFPTVSPLKELVMVINTLWILLKTEVVQPH